MKRIEITRGDTHHELITVSRGGQLIDLTGCMLWLTAKHRFSDPDSAAVFQKTMVVGGGIEALPDQAGAGKGKATVTINPADTVALTEPTSLVFDVQLREPDGRISTPNDARGIIVVALDATIATGDPPIPEPGPAPPAVGAFAQWNGAVTVWSDFSLPLTAEADDFGKVLSVTAEGVASWVALTGGGGPEVDPRLPAHGTSGNLLRSTGSEWASVAVTLPNLPASPGDNNKLAIGSSGNLAYLASTAADRFLRGDGSGGWSESAYALPASIGSNGHVLTVVAGVATWAAPVTELPAIGNEGEVLTVSGGSPVWTAPAPGGGGGLTAPANPADNGKLAIASGGDLVYVAAIETYALHWSANGPGLGASTNYLVAGGGNVGTAAANAVPGVHVMLDDGVLDILQIMHSSPALSITFTYTIEVNEAPTALTLDMASNAAQASNVVNSVAVVRGDRVRCFVVNPGSTNSNIRINAMCRFRRVPS